MDKKYGWVLYNDRVTVIVRLKSEEPVSSVDTVG